MCLRNTFTAYLANSCSLYDVHIRNRTSACTFQFQNWWLDSNEIWHKYHATVGQPKILLFISYLTSCYQNGWCIGLWGVKVTTALLPRYSNHTDLYNQSYSYYHYCTNYSYLEQLSSVRMLRIKHAWGILCPWVWNALLLVPAMSYKLWRNAPNETPVEGKGLGLDFVCLIYLCKMNLQKRCTNFLEI